MKRLVLVFLLVNLFYINYAQEVNHRENNSDTINYIFNSFETYNFDASHEDIEIFMLTPSQSLPRVIDGTTPIKHNADWVVVRREFNGANMLLVPAGSFAIGDQELDWAKPVHTQRFDKPFWIDETEVTRGAYEQCVSAGVCVPTVDNQYSTTVDQPINKVTWYQAVAYCEWRGARLPTEAEWEYAARGPDNVVYPWGNEFDSSRVHYSENSANRTAVVGNYPSGKSWVGALDISGNLWEWTSSLYKDYPYANNRNFTGKEASVNETIVLRGGSFNFDTDHLRAANRGRNNADVDSSLFGFRCARS